MFYVSQLLKNTPKHCIKAAIHSFTITVVFSNDIWSCFSPGYTRSILSAPALSPAVGLEMNNTLDSTMYVTFKEDRHQTMQPYVRTT